MPTNKWHDIEVSTIRKMIGDTMGSRSWSVYGGRIALTIADGRTHRGNEKVLCHDPPETRRLLLPGTALSRQLARPREGARASGVREERASALLPSNALPEESSEHRRVKSAVRRRAQDWGDKGSAPTPSSARRTRKRPRPSAMAPIPSQMRMAKPPPMALAGHGLTNALSSDSKRRASRRIDHS